MMKHILRWVALPMVLMLALLGSPLTFSVGAVTDPPTVEPSISVEASMEPSAEASPSVEPTPVVSEEPSVEATPTAEPTPVVSEEPAPVEEPAVEPAPVESVEAMSQPKAAVPTVEATPTAEPTPVVSEEPTVETTPTAEPTPVVSEEPTAEPTPVVSEEPTVEATPTAEPTPVVSEEPTAEATPTVEPRARVSVSGLAVPFAVVAPPTEVTEVVGEAGEAVTVVDQYGNTFTFQLTKVSDGTGHGTTGACFLNARNGYEVGDNTPDDGIVCTKDTAEYRVDWSASTGVNAMQMTASTKDMTSGTTGSTLPYTISGSTITIKPNNPDVSGTFTYTVKKEVPTEKHIESLTVKPSWFSVGTAATAVADVPVTWIETDGPVALHTWLDTNSPSADPISFVERDGATYRWITIHAIESPYRTSVRDDTKRYGYPDLSTSHFDYMLHDGPEGAFIEGNRLFLVADQPSTSVTIQATLKPEYEAQFNILGHGEDRAFDTLANLPEWATETVHGTNGEPNTTWLTEAIEMKTLRTPSDEDFVMVEDPANSPSSSQLKYVVQLGTDEFAPTGSQVHEDTFNRILEIMNMETIRNDTATGEENIVRTNYFQLAFGVDIDRDSVYLGENKIPLKEVERMLYGIYDGYGTVLDFWRHKWDLGESVFEQVFGSGRQVSIYLDPPAAVCQPESLIGFSIQDSEALGGAIEYGSFHHLGTRTYFRSIAEQETSDSELTSNLPNNNWVSFCGPPLPSIELTKTADKYWVSEFGETINYEFLVKNTGTVELEAVTVNDWMLGGRGAVFCPQDRLAPEESMTCSGMLSVDWTHLNSRSIDNTATVSGMTPDYEYVEDDDSTSTYVAPAPRPDSMPIRIKAGI